MINIIFKYWIEILLTAITSGIIYVFKQYAGLRNGLEALLKNEIVRIYETYSKLGYCPSYMKENANEIYVNYNKLKRNDMATSMINALYKLPNQPKEVKNEENFERQVCWEVT